MDHDDKEQPVIIKRVKKVMHGGHHGGAWKIAYADFVTAMMAFFMLLWLLSLLNKYQLQGVSEYFKRPLKTVLTGSSPDGNKKTQSVENNYIEDDNDHVQLIYPINQPSTSKVTPTAIGEEDNLAGKEDGKDKDKDKDKDKNKETKKEADEQIKELQMSEEEKIKAASNVKDSAARLDKLKSDLDFKFQNNPELKSFQENLNFQIIEDGIKITLHDSTKNPMFELGGVQISHAASDLVSWLAGEFNGINRNLIILGHSDGQPYPTVRGFSNWELSTGRANAARQMLVNKGMVAEKVLECVGASDNFLFNKKNPYDPSNRRVEIVILNDQAKQRLLNQ